MAKRKGRLPFLPFARLRLVGGLNPRTNPERLGQRPFLSTRAPRRHPITTPHRTTRHHPTAPLPPRVRESRARTKPHIPRTTLARSVQGPGPGFSLPGLFQPPFPSSLDTPPLSGSAQGEPNSIFGIGKSTERMRRGKRRRNRGRLRRPALYMTDRIVCLDHDRPGRDASAGDPSAASDRSALRRRGSGREPGRPGRARRWADGTGCRSPTPRGPAPPPP